MGENPEQQFAVLQSRIRERLAQLRSIPPGAAAYTPATDDVIAATEALIAYEHRLPVLLDQGPRRLSLLIVRWSGVICVAVGFSLAVASVLGWLPRWWLVPVILVLAVAALLLMLPVHPPCDAHVTLRPGSVLIASGTLAVAVCAVARFPFWALLVGLAAMVAGVWHIRRSSVLELL